MASGHRAPLAPDRRTAATPPAPEAAGHARVARRCPGTRERPERRPAADGSRPGRAGTATDRGQQQRAASCRGSRRRRRSHMPAATGRPLVPRLSNRLARVRRGNAGGHRPRCGKRRPFRTRTRRGGTHRDGPRQRRAAQRRRRRMARRHRAWRRLARRRGRRVRQTYRCRPRPCPFEEQGDGRGHPQWDRPRERNRPRWRQRRTTQRRGPRARIRSRRAGQANRQRRRRCDLHRSCGGTAQPCGALRVRQRLRLRYLRSGGGGIWGNRPGRGPAEQRVDPCVLTGNRTGGTGTSAPD